MTMRPGNTIYSSIIPTGTGRTQQLATTPYLALSESPQSSDENQVMTVEDEVEQTPKRESLQSDSSGVHEFPRKHSLSRTPQLPFELNMDRMHLLTPPAHGINVIGLTDDTDSDETITSSPPRIIKCSHSARAKSTIPALEIGDRRSTRAAGAGIHTDTDTDTDIDTDTSSTILSDDLPACRNIPRSFAWRLADLGVPFPKAVLLEDLFVDCAQCLTVILNQFRGLPVRSRLFAKFHLNSELQNLHEVQADFVADYYHAIFDHVRGWADFKQAQDFSEGQAIIATLRMWDEQITDWMCLDRTSIRLVDLLRSTEGCWLLISDLLEPGR